MKHPLHKAFSWYFSKSALPYWAILVIDCLLLVISALFAYTLNHGLLNTAGKIGALACTLGIFLIVFIGCFRLFRTYMGIIRFSSFVDLQRLGMALLTGMVLVMLIQYFILPNPYLVEFWLSDILLTCLMALTLMWTVRILVKRVFDVSVCRETAHRRAFIYGVMTGGVSLAKSINRPGSQFSLAGFVSDGKNLDKRTLMGVPVYINDGNIADVMLLHDAHYLLVSPLKSEALRNNNEMINSLLEAGIRIYMMPQATEWDGHSDISHHQLEEVKIEDLLPRAQIDVDMEAIGKMLTGRRILVTGAAGSIGSEISRQIASFKPDSLILIDQAESPLHSIRLLMARDFSSVNAPTIVADICNEVVMERIFNLYCPEFVFHAAAYKHVPMMEDNPMESIRNNVFGTRVIADLSLKYGVDKFVMVSTDKAVNPTNVMGCSKRICEIYVQSLDEAVAEKKVKGHTRYVTTRFGNVLGSNGSVIPIFQEQIKKGGPVTVTHPDIIRFFMLIPEACKLVLEAGSMGHGGEIFVFDMGKPVKIADLARRMIQLSGANDIEIKFTGLRDGEKLYEEVLNDEEITLPTFHPKIKIAKVRQFAYTDVCIQIDRMVEDTRLGDDMLTVREMKELVPEFKSQHSKYEALDNK